MGAEMRRLCTSKVSGRSGEQDLFICHYVSISNSIHWHVSHQFWVVLILWCWQMQKHFFIHAIICHWTPSSQLWDVFKSTECISYIHSLPKGIWHHHPISHALLEKLGSVVSGPLPKQTHNVPSVLLSAFYGEARKSWLLIFHISRRTAHKSTL